MEKTDKIRQKKEFIVNFIYALLIVAIIYVCLKYLLGIIMPFFIAFIIVMLLNPLVKWFCKITKLKKKIVFPVFLVLFYALIGFLIVLFGVKIFNSARDVFIELPEVYTQTIEPTLIEAMNSIQNFFNNLDPSFNEFLNNMSENILSSLGSIISNISMNLVGWATSFATSVPGLLLNVVISVISAFFMANDLGVYSEFFKKHLSEKTMNLINNIKRQLGTTLWDYIRSYALILFITFAELAIGLSIVGINNSVLIAVLIALFDILPIVGTGMIMLPWTIIEFISGNILRGIGVGIVYVIVVVVRQIIEPKIVGNKVGLNPLVTLMSMIIGLRLFGGIGLLALPVTLALINALDKQGVIHIFRKGKRKNEEKEKSSPQSDVQINIKKE